MPWIISVKDKFDSAHHLTKLKGSKCLEKHGHTYYYRVDFISDKLREEEIVFDFSEIKSFLKQAVTNQYDHKDLNDEMDCETSAENLAQIIYNIVKEGLGVIYGLKVHKVRVHEGGDNYAEYFE